ncbi:MAG: hypothetical protein JSW71_21080 [Gemmatimonadota bacterium]|nr:MAG: hypothetical protein JSW71_21080 [Gemmatimonadota bacterium]
MELISREIHGSALKARARTQPRGIVLDIGLGALLFDSRGGVGAAAHVGFCVKRHLGFRVAADVVERPGAHVGAVYASVNLVKPSDRLSPTEGSPGAVAAIGGNPGELDLG